MASLTTPKPEFLEFRARFEGYLQWVCPHCKALNAGRRQKINFRKPQVTCKDCNRRFVVGFHLGGPKYTLPEANSLYIEVPVHYLTHLVDHPAQGTFTFGRALGTLWWACPCRKLQKASLTTECRTISCAGCKTCYHVGVILYRSQKGRAKPLPTPLDWVLPIWDLG